MIGKMKLIVMVLVLGVLFLTGCSPVRSSVGRKATNVTKLSEEKEITLTVLETIKVSGSIIGFGAGDVGLKLSVKNNSSEVKYLVWSASSLGFEGVTSRIITGNDKFININSIVPNTALMPNKEMNVVIYAADVIQYMPTYKYSASYYYTETPIKESIDLILSYSGNNINELKQAVYHIELEEIKEKEQKDYMNSYQN